MQAEGVWRLQTKEAAEWDAAYRAELRGLRSNPTELASRRRSALDAALSVSLKGLVSVSQGRSAVSRKLVRLGPDEKAPADGLVVRVHNGWDETLKTVASDIAAQPETDATIHILIERQDAERLEEALRQRQASKIVIERRRTTTNHREQIYKGYQEIIVRDIAFKPEVTLYRRERWATPDGRTVTADLPAGVVGGCGPNLHR
jgi:hypothetical protein